MTCRTKLLKELNTLIDWRNSNFIPPPKKKNQKSYGGIAWKASFKGLV